MALVDDLRAEVWTAFGNKRPGMFGFYPPLSNIAGVYRPRINAAVAARNSTAVSSLTNDWASDNQHASDASSAFRGFANASDEKFYDDVRFMAARNWVAPEQYQEAPKTVIAAEHVAAIQQQIASGELPVTEEARQAIQEAIESTPAGQALKLDVPLFPASSPATDTRPRYGDDLLQDTISVPIGAGTVAMPAPAVNQSVVSLDPGMPGAPTLPVESDSMTMQAPSIGTVTNTAKLIGLAVLALILYAVYRSRGG